MVEYLVIKTRAFGANKKNNMIQLTQKGKEIYQSTTYSITTKYSPTGIEFWNGSIIVASNPLELKALLDMGLIEIK